MRISESAEIRKRSFKFKRAVFRVCRLILLVLACALFNKPFAFLPAFAILTVNAVYLLSRLVRKGFCHKCFTATQLCAGVYLCGVLMADNMPGLPRFFERTHWTLLGLDAVVVLWAVFWVSFLAMTIIEVYRYSKRKVAEEDI